MGRTGTVASVFAALSLAGCTSCDRLQSDATIDDRQLALLTEGTTGPTPHGCEVVCWDVRYDYVDGGARDAGPSDASADDGGTLVARGAINCTLTGRRLHCDGPVSCAR